MTNDAVREDLESCAAWLRERGLPSFCRTRRVRPSGPLLVVAAGVVLAEVALVAPSPMWPWQLDALMILAACAAAAIGAVLAAKIRAHSRRSTGRYAVEIGFVLSPLLIASAVDGIGYGVLYAAFNASLVLAHAAEERFSLTAMLAWAARFAVRELHGAWQKIAGSLPILTVLLLAMFISTEIWQIADGADSWNLAMVSGAMVITAAGSAVARTRRQIRYENSSDGDTLAGTPAAGWPTPKEPPALTISERANIAGLLAMAQSTVILGAAAAFAAAMLLIGALLVGPGLLETWVGSPGDAIIQLQWVVDLYVTQQHLAVAALMGGIAALVFSVNLLTDEQFQQNAQASFTEEISTALLVRAAYLNQLETLEKLETRDQTTKS